MHQNVPIRKVKYVQFPQNASKITKTPAHSNHRLKMSLWVDKHRPRTLEKLTYNHSLSISLKAIVTALLSAPQSLSSPQTRPCLLIVCSLTVGRVLRLPAFTCIWALWRRKEDSCCRCIERFIRSCGREIED